jgi:hypothetical protein
MKSNRRHELKTNELADWLGRHLDQIKPYTKAISGAVLALFVVVVVIALVSQRNRQLETAAWNEYTLAMGIGGTVVDMEELRRVSEDHAGTQAAVWADLAWADAKLRQGTTDLFRNRDQALAQLRDAVERYLVLVEDGRAPSIVHDRALYGLAQAYEARGELDKAEQTYRSVRGKLGDIALQRAEILSQRSIQDFYDWFATAELPRAPVTGLGGLESLPADFLQSLNLGADFLPPVGPSGGVDFSGFGVEPAGGVPATPGTSAPPIDPASVDLSFPDDLAPSDDATDTPPPSTDETSPPTGDPAPDAEPSESAEPTPPEN